MTSLRKKVTSYFRQLSFHNEPRERKSNVNENSFITKYLTGQTKLKDGPPVLYGKSPNDLPNFEIGAYMTGPKIVGCSTGPNGGLTTVRRIEKHLSITDPDIDFIDTQEELAETIKHKSPIRNNASKRPLDNTTMVIKVAGQEYKVTNRKSRSLGSLTDLTLSHEDSCTSSSIINNAACNNNTSPTPPPLAIVTDNNNELSEQCKNQKPQLTTTDCDANRKQTFSTNNCDDAKSERNVNRNFSLSKSKSECNPFEHRKKGKIIRLTERPQTQQDSHRDTGHRSTRNNDDPLLPKHWNRKTDYVYGISDSLYDTNQVTKNKNGNPIADCYGIIAREDSAILALADGVNWGEKACVAAKSAIHGCLHYLNKTIFDDTSLFDIDFATKSDSNPQFYDSQNSPINTSYISPPAPSLDDETAPVAAAESNENRVTNTTEVFISLLRAFNCAHNLILENQGMLTTLTVAVVLPLKSSHYQERQNESSDVVLTQELNLPRRKRSATGQQNNSDFSSDRINNDEGSKGDKYICCVCNVGDTLAYVYSAKYGVRELTKGSHDVYCNRDMRDALGALGPVDGINPELNNLTLSVTTLDAGDIVMVASDGLTDNYDPTVCKFTVNTPITERTKAERQHLGAHGKEMPSVKPIITPAPRHPRRVSSSGPKPSKVVTPSNVSRLAAKDIQSSSSTSSSTTKIDVNITKNKENTPSSSDICDNPLVAQFLADNALEKKSETGKPQLSSHKPTTTTTSHPHHHHHHQQQQHHQKRVAVGLSENKNKTLNPLAKSSSVSGVFKSKTTTFSAEPKYSFLRSKTSLEIAPPQKIIHRNEDGLPYVTPIQKYELTLLLIEDILKRGISGKERECTTAKTLCENLFRYTVSITAAKRHTLEDVDLYFDNKNDILIEVSQKEKKMRRKRCLEKVQNLPGKLDHVSVVAYNVGNRIVEFC